MINVKNLDQDKIKRDTKSNKNILIDYIGLCVVKDFSYPKTNSRKPFTSFYQ